MKYFLIVISAIILSLFESTIGGISPFVYITYILFLSIILFWKVDNISGFLALGLGGILLDLFHHNWLGTTYLAFFLGLLVLFAINSIVDLMADERKLFGSITHLFFSVIFNYFLIILQNNKFANISYSFLITNVIVSIIVFTIVWIIISTGKVRKKGLYA